MAVLKHGIQYASMKLNYNVVSNSNLRSFRLKFTAKDRYSFEKYKKTSILRSIRVVKLKFIKVSVFKNLELME